MYATCYHIFPLYLYFYFCHEHLHAFVCGSLQLNPHSPYICLHNTHEQKPTTTMEPRTLFPSLTIAAGIFPILLLLFYIFFLAKNRMVGMKMSNYGFFCKWEYVHCFVKKNHDRPLSHWQNGTTEYLLRTKECREGPFYKFKYSKNFHRLCTY